ncbi:MAG: ParB/RepB/Spo0J family partition protein [Candidatus Omnitrophica bacterium]|nr:ParB/RepB/Spo0J family partition protein [Candidatus Omnitrophota bacterium]
MEKKALGKGISALIPPGAIEDNNVKITFLPIEKIKPNPYQPREDFNSQGMDDLVQSIKEKGIIQPVLVRRHGEHYELIAGERRYRAANMLNINELPAIIKDVDDKDSLELALIENIQRENLNPIEEAKAYHYLIEKFGLTQEKIAEVLGKSRAGIANFLRLLKLPLEVQKDIATGQLSIGHGKILLELDDTNRQRILSQEVISKLLSVRELEILIKKEKPKGSLTRWKNQQTDPYVRVIEDQLQQLLGTKVRIMKKKKRGHIKIEFYSQEDFDRIARKLGGI